MNHEKFSPMLASTVSDASTGESVRVIVQYRAPLSSDEVSVRAAPMGAQVQRIFQRIPASAMQLPADRLEAYADNDEVERIWPDLPVHTCLDSSVPHIGVPFVWERSGRGRGIKIAIVDTGIDAAHADFAGRIEASEDFTGKGNAGDGHGHGTHVASIAAGSGQASNGAYVGVAPAARLYVAKVLADNGSGFTSDVMAGVEWAVDQGAQVINLSLGSPGPADGDDALSLLCDAAVEERVVVCAAAGNSGPGASTVGPPGAAKLVITVGATNDQDAIAGFSSRGPTSDGRQKPDLVLPGVGIVAARANNTSMGSPVNEAYTSAQGTSMATPHAAGIVALLLQSSPGLTPAQIKTMLTSTARDLGVDGNAQGAGRGQADAAYLKLHPEPDGDGKNGGCLNQLLRVFGLGK